ncbi:MAG: hypothetical protein AAFQ58_19125 [Pseudomonadota bacterium]
MEPASTIIKKLGGAAAVAKMAGVHVTRVYMWMRSKDVGGTGGVIPLKHAPVLIEQAKQREIEINPADFVPVEGAA